MRDCSPCLRAIVITPAEPPKPDCLGLSDMAFPYLREGRLPRHEFSRLTQRSLALWPADLLNGYYRPLTSRALDRLLPPDRSRLLPGGQPPSGEGLAPSGSITPLHGAPQMIISFSKTRARRASEGHSNARKSPTVPQTQVIISFFGTRARRASKGLNLSPTQMIIIRPR